MAVTRRFGSRAGAPFQGAATTRVVATMIGALFAGSTLLTPLYVVYKQLFGFSQITLTLVYGVYAAGNLAALLLLGRLSDAIGRRRTAMAGTLLAIASAVIFLLANGTAALYAGRIVSGLAIGVGAGTGAAWLSDLLAGEDKSRASALATSSNFAGLGIGAFVAGLLADYAPWPLRLPFIVYAAALVAVLALVWFSAETVEQRRSPLQALLSLRPQLSVPREIRAQFVAPAVTGFGAMALVGFYAALVPGILAEQLHHSSHLVAGAIFLELAGVVTACILATQRLPSHTAMICALLLMPPGVALVVIAQALASMAILTVATATCGIAVALGYRGSLQVANEIAPEDKRAEVASCYFICGFAGNALPVIGVGVVATLAGPTIAGIAFALLITLFAVAAMTLGLKYAR